MRLLSRLLGDDAGTTTIEYAVMLAFITAVCIVLVASLGSRTQTQYSRFNGQINAV